MQDTPTLSTDSDPALLRAFLDAVPDILFYCAIDEEAAELRILMVNRTAEVVLGRTAASLVGTVPRELLMPDAQPSEATRRELLRQGRLRGMIEYPKPVLLPEDPDSGMYLRIRLVVLPGERALMQLEVRPVEPTSPA